jgi:2-oxo-3-hexenedioate decarboxylase
MDAEKILSDAADAYRAALGERLVAAYALGSLAHGGFSPLVSDVDLGLIVADPIELGDAYTIQAVAEAQKATGSALAARLSVFWGTPSTLRGEQDGGRFPPLDRLDLIENGRLLTGIDGRTELPHPSPNELLISGAEFALEFLAGESADPSPAATGLGSMRPATDDAVHEIYDPELLLSRGIRRVTKLVLFPVRFMFTAATGRVGTNDEAAAAYLAIEHAPARPLVSAALRWRDAAPTDEASATQLLDQLPALYQRYIADHVGRLGSVGRDELTRRFERWRERLALEGKLTAMAETVLEAFSSHRLIPPLSSQDDSLGEDAAYAIASRIHARRARRGETTVGRKIGFTNRTIWPRYGVWAPIWGYMYDSTVHHAPNGHARVPVDHLLQPHIEPEIQLHFASTPPVTRDEQAILECIDWIAHGFELVQCPFPDWKFEAVDTIAACGLHGALVIGPRVTVADIEDCARKLREFTLTLSKNGQEQVSGGGANVLDSPLLAFAHLAEVLATQPQATPIRAGDVVTTGTLTVPLPVAPDDTFDVALGGIELPGLTLTAT